MRSRYLIDVNGLRWSYGVVMNWWTETPTVHALIGEKTRCGRETDTDMVPLTHALKVASPCRLCWQRSHTEDGDDR